MSDARVARRRLVEHALAHVRQLPLAMLLELLVPVARLRALARTFGLSPKGGFRLDKAPARVLAPMLAEIEDGDRLDQVMALLAPDRVSGGAPEERAAEGQEPGSAAVTPPPADEAGPVKAPPIDPVASLRAAELQRTRDELERAREGSARALERESELRRQLQQRDDELRQLLAGQKRQQRPTAESARQDERELRQRVRDLEQEIAAREDADTALRRQLAADKSRLRELEEDVAELEALVPKGRRRRRVEDPPPPPAGDRRFLVPSFLPSFYRSLDGKDRRAIERAFSAVLLFCTEGHAYPGLEVKQMGGQDTWSLRASRGLRVYFRHRDDGGVEFLELADREEQHTTLRRLKER